MRRLRVSKKQTNLIIGLVMLLISAIYQSLQSKSQDINSQANIAPTLIASQSAELHKVKKVIDGDTIQLETGEVVRYIGIDTPETKHPQKKLQCFGKEAMEKNRQLVEGKLIKMEKDISETDRYKRLLRYIYLPTDATPSGVFINEYLLKEGYASAATFPPDVKFSEYFISLQQEARINKRGLWKNCK